MTDTEHTYIVCRALDTDPRARTRAALLALDPRALVDGLRTAALNAGATKAFLCVDAGDAPGVAAVEAAAQAAPGATAGAAPGPDIAVVPMTPALVLADDSALLRVVEGRQAIPHVSVPPAAPPTLWGRPAVVCDLEELAEATASAPSTLTVTVWIGGEARTADVPESATVRAALRDAVGIDAGEGASRVVRYGGSLGRFLAGPGLDTPRGPGGAWLPAVLEVVPAGTCGVAAVRDALRELSAASCGACVVCREGTRQLADMLTETAEGRAAAEVPDLMRELGVALEAGSICGLGVSAADVLRTGLDVFSTDFGAHFHGAPCPEADTGA